MATCNISQLLQIKHEKKKFMSVLSHEITIIRHYVSFRPRSQTLTSFKVTLMQI